ncbi:interleukin-6 receptor subunit beta [Eucyclogobius newberryi]|uniref:interleukin-6 receptor subunit beta n=1 Tax=Eucyclogobius newberryi TaxID=166745 RepID=UPI003B5A4C0C
MEGWSLTTLGLIVVLPSVICFSLKAPALIGCVFIHQANVTCKWTSGDSHATRYTLNVRRMTPNTEKLWTCSTRSTSCTVVMESVNYNFCINVTAHSRHGNVTTAQRCQPGIKEIMLRPVTLNDITRVDGRPRCLTLNWGKEEIFFLVSNSRIKAGKLESQIEFKAHGQPGARLANVTVTDFSFVACLFSPDTEYNVRLRHRYRSDGSVWSRWSNERRGRTGEDAPSSGPIFWRRVIHKDGSRLASLLWKPLAHYLANGRVLFYNVTCLDGNTHVIPDKGNCSSLDISHTSCALKLPLGRCSCSISASTAVGTSPKAWLWFNGAKENERPPPSSLSVTAVHDRRLDLTWAPPPSTAGVSPSAFVVEWVVVTQENDTSLHWERVNGSTTAVITDGVEPFKRFAVSVRALYANEGAGQSETEYVYTRQGAPSAGPVVQVQADGGTVKLSWTLPVEQLHGFITNYILHYGTDKRVVLPGDVEQYSLSLPPGHYEFCMQASTEAGEGVMGPTTSVHIGPEEINILITAVISIGLISLVLMLMACLVQNKIVKGRLFTDVPNPSRSSLAKWSPEIETAMMSTDYDVKYSEVVLLGDRERDDYESDQDQTLCYHDARSDPQTYHPFRRGTKYHENQRATNTTNFTSCPTVYSSVLLSKAEPPSELQRYSFPNVTDLDQPLGGASELFSASTKNIPVPFDLKQPCDVVCPYDFTSAPLLTSGSSFQHISASSLHFPDLNFNDLINLSQGLIQSDPYLPV